jgi:predicted nucleotidyltransferase
MEIVVKIKFGSHLYGTNTPTSDLDYKSVYIPEAKEILLQRVPGTIGISKRPKADGEKNLPCDVDSEAYSLQRYLQLLAEGQTVAIDMLFAPEPEIRSALWSRIRANKERLLTKRSAAFVGYCRTQANKYGIKGSRVAAAKAAAIYRRIHESYGARARQAESNEGIDWKALSHAVRVGNEALELLLKHEITFPLPNAKHILDIKQGRIPYKDVAEEIEGLLETVENCAKISSLRDEADQRFIDELVLEEYARVVYERF